MIDIRPIVYVLGRILVVLAILMLAPAVIDWRAGLHNGIEFVESAIITGGVGLMLSLATANALGQAMSARQAYLMTAVIWFGVPLFGGLPFMLGEPHLSFTDGHYHHWVDRDRRAGYPATRHEPVARDAEFVWRLGDCLCCHDLPAHPARRRDAIFPHRRF